MIATGLKPRTTSFVNEHSTIWPVWPNGSVFVYELSGSGFESKLQSLRFAPASSKEFLDIQAIIECGFTLKCVRDMARNTLCETLT